MIYDWGTRGGIIFGRFVLMVQDAIPSVNKPNGSTVHNIGQLAGEESHVLTEAEMPSHTHTTTIPRNGGDHPSGGRSDWTVYYSQNKVSSSTGGNQPHNNIPPYYTLVYVMKL
jgi:microcystin-dependent protein